jgi:hypothetical protein
LPLRPPVALALRAIISPSSQDSTPLIDMEILQQLQEMDDDDDEREFSRSIVDEFREQVPEQLAIMKNHLCVSCLPFHLAHPPLAAARVTDES